MLARRMSGRMLVWVALWTLVRGSAAQGVPAGQVTALNGTTLMLPEQMKGHVTVCLVGFSRAAGKQTEAWWKQMRAELPGSVAVLEFPMLAEAPRILRGTIVGSMRRGTEAAELGAMFPVLSDAEAWKRFAGYSGGDDAYVVVVDAGGQVRLRVHGPVTAHAAEVKAAVDGLLKSGR